jgi:hypothetical protein
MSCCAWDSSRQATLRYTIDNPPFRMVSRLRLLLALVAVCPRGTAATNVTTHLPWPGLDNLDDPVALRAVLSTVLSELAVARGEREALRRETVEMRADYAVLKAKLMLGESTNEASNEGHARRVLAEGHGPEPEPEPAGQGEAAIIYRRKMTHPTPNFTLPSPGPPLNQQRCADNDRCLHAAGNRWAGYTCTDSSQFCTRPKWRSSLEQCCPVTCGTCGHRRAQVQEQCLVSDLVTRMDAVTEECCNEPAEDCSSGRPATCNVGCSDVVLTFWRDCQATFVATSGAPTAQIFEDVVQLCQREAGTAQASSAREFSLTCTSEGITDCVPRCGEATHGHLLLATINGEDSTYNCEFHHGLCVLSHLSRDTAHLHYTVRITRCQKTQTDHLRPSKYPIDTHGSAVQGRVVFWVGTSGPSSPLSSSVRQASTRLKWTRTMLGL